MPVTMNTSFSVLESLSGFGSIGSFDGDIPGFSLDTSGTTARSDSLISNTPGFSLEAQTGIQLQSSVLTLSLTVEAEISNVARLEDVTPSITINAHGYIGYTAKASLITPKLSIYAITGAIFKSKTPKFNVVSEGLVGSVINSELIVPRITLNGSIEVENYGVANFSVPGISSISGILSENFSRFSLLATGFTTLSVTLSTQVMNTSNGALTEYINFEFDNIIQMDGDYYGVKTDGLYKLTGDTDNTVDIDASFETAPTNFDNIQLKNISYLYISARTDSLFSVQSIYDEKYSPVYQSANMNRTDPCNWRVQLARGLKAVYWGSKINNVNGSDFQIHSMSSYVNTLKRRR